MKIYKYTIPVIDSVIEMSLPIGATFLCLKIQGRKPCIWFMLDPDTNREIRKFAWYGTGHEMRNEKHIHIGTTMNASEDLVFHLFELI